MYYLNLMDSTILPINRLNPSTFEANSEDTQLYNKLENNLALAFLSREDEIIEDIYIDYCLQNFSYSNGIAYFRIGPWDEVHKEPNRNKRRYNKKGESK